MLAVAEALECVLTHTAPLPPRTTLLSPIALGRALAEDVASDLDMPPFTKALMDGFALRAVDHSLPLTIVEEILAGKTPSKPIGPGQTSRIMTGAAIPAGADAVVQHERTRLSEGKVIIDGPIKPGMNILPQGREMRRGETVLASGCILGPVEFGLLAAVGRTMIKTIPFPRVTIIGSGDELVDPPAIPGPGQIRNSNSPMLVAQAASAGGLPRYLGLAKDSEDSLRPMISEGLETAKVVVLSGGVSEGKMDLIPGLLQAMGVKIHFHKIRLKPGKPLLFGTIGSVLVFGLPGNPVSSLVCFALFVRPALRKLAGHGESDPMRLVARMTRDFPYSSDRPTYHPARVKLCASGWEVEPVPWFGSADLRALHKANALVLLPEGNQVHAAGEMMDAWRLDG